MSTSGQPLVVRFVGGDDGPWSVSRSVAVVGAGLPDVAALTMAEHDQPDPTAAWVLTGVVSNERYVTRAERSALEARQQPLGRPEATRGVLIPIRKSPAWWSLTQDERRDIFEERSHHTALGLAALPGVARRLHHGRDLGEPFDFLTWFEFAPDHAADFDRLLDALRSSEEWRYVEREVEIRVTRA
jgi:chlorite dismutase